MKSRHAKRYTNTRRLVLGLFALCLLGTALQFIPGIREADARDRTHFLARTIAQAAFDSLSAATGTGIILDQEKHTPIGRWLITLLGAAGATLYLHSLLSALFNQRRSDAESQPPNRTLCAKQGAKTPTNENDPYHSNERNTPSPLPAILITITTLTIIAGIAVVAYGESSSYNESIRLSIALATASGLTFNDEPLTGRPPIAGISTFAAIGFPLLLFGLVPKGRQNLAGGVSPRKNGDEEQKPRRGDTFLSSLLRPNRTALLLFISFTAIAAISITIAETPPQTQIAARGNEFLNGQPTATRLARAACQLIAAAGTGVTTEPLADGAVQATTHIIVALAILVAGFLAAPTGGITWTFIACIVCRGQNAAHNKHQHKQLRRVALRMIIALTTLTAVVAFGMLAIHRMTASEYESSPTVAAALLDASACVNGANITTGVVHRITDPNLSGGIGQPVDQYSYGIVWLMLAMLVGRVLPIWIIESTHTRRDSSDAA